MKMIKNYLTLKEGFRSVQKRTHYVASSLFPFILSNKNDLNLVFFNYWTNKNQIKIKNLKLSIKIYNHNGNLIYHYEKEISKYHNQISIKNILEKNKIKTFNLFGSANVEIISLDALSFPFPAITGIYNSGDIYSAVHSAGRLKNNSETQNILYTEETNWSCKFKNNISPFFHYFVGNTLPRKKYITVKLLDQNNKIKKIKKIFINYLKPFSSKIFLIKNIFEKTKFEINDFVSVTLEHNSIFPRMIVGNFYSNLNFYEVTHSFPRVKLKDYCPNNKNYNFHSKISGYRNEDLDLNLKIFPTTCEGNFIAEKFIKKFKDKQMYFSGEKIEFTKKKLKSTCLIPFENKVEVQSFKLKGKRIPSRLNTSYIYKVKNSKNEFSLDIADGARSIIFPKKITHWGHGYISEGFDTVIMILNDNYEKNYFKSYYGKLDIYSQNNFKKSIRLNIKPGTLCSLNLTKIKSLKNLSKMKLNFISWQLKLSEPGCECFWISYRKKDGSIFGDHSF